MGSGASKRGGSLPDLNAATLSVGSGGFRHGHPSVRFDEAIGCFKAVGYTTKRTLDGAVRSVTTTSAPGYLYRLVNRATGEWYFYNDTASYYFSVTGYFGPQNSIQPTGSARMYREMPSGLLIVELTVSPLETAPYLVGDIHDGFDINFVATPSHAYRRSITSVGSGVSCNAGRGPSAGTPSLIMPVRHPSTACSAATNWSAGATGGRAWLAPDGGVIITSDDPQGPMVPPVARTMSFCPQCHSPSGAASMVPTPAPQQALALSPSVMPLRHTDVGVGEGDSPDANSIHHHRRRYRNHYRDSAEPGLPPLPSSSSARGNRKALSPSVASGSAEDGGALTASSSERTSKTTSRDRESGGAPQTEVPANETEHSPYKTNETALPGSLAVSGEADSPM